MELMCPSFKITLLLFQLCLILSPCQLLTLNEDQEHTAKIHALRKEIKTKIYPSTSLVHNYICDDLYIHNWLQKNHFDVNRTSNNLLQHLKWRHIERIDSIDKENWRFYKAEYPQFFDTVDNFGRPVAEIWLADWNVRRALVIGQKKKLIRWTTYLLEMTERRLYQIRNDTTAKNITNGVEIIDLEGFNYISHGCPSCITVYTGLAKTCEQHYPGIWKEVHMINAGPTFRMMLNTGRDFNYAQKNLTKVYSHRNEWLPVFDREISKDQRSIRVGGNIDRILYS